MSRGAIPTGRWTIFAVWDPQQSSMDCGGGNHEVQGILFCFMFCFDSNSIENLSLGFRLVLPMECVFDCVSSDDGVCPESKTDTDHKCGIYMSLLLYILVNVLFRR